jgi:hypothetical protein
MEFRWPRNGQVHDLLPLLVEVRKSASQSVQEIVIHVADDAWIEPAAICALAVELSRVTFRQVRFTGDAAKLNYLSRLDLFKILKFEYQEQFTRHPEAGRFVPLMRIGCSQDVHSAVSGICDMVARFLDNAKIFVPAMEWAVNEVVDNIVIHAQAKTPGFVGAQYYPEKEEIKIGIVDGGLGIRATLAERYRFTKDFEAIEKAIERGVTRNLEVGQGNGLAGTVEIAQLNEGEIAIYSGMGSFESKSKSSTFSKMQSRFDGTIVSMLLRTNRPVNLMDTFMAEGAVGWNYFDAEAQRLVDGGGLRVVNEILHARGREPAKALRNKILCLLDSIDEGKTLRLDFDSVRTPSSSFWDELLGRLVCEISPAVFRAKIEIVNMDPVSYALAKTVVKQRMQSC